MSDPAPAALVTGAARRLGAAMVRRLVTEGFRVALHCNASRDEADALAAELQAAGGVCEVVTGDLLHRAEVEAVWDAAQGRLGPISLAVNLKAPLWLTERLASQRDLPPGALVVNMLDNKCFALNPDFFTYTLSKTALHTATTMCAMRFDGRPRVCGIAPSITLISGKQTQANFEKSARINPLGRRVTPDDICEALMLLWRDAAQNGQVLVLDGGQVLWRLDRDVAFLVKEGLADG